MSTGPVTVAPFRGDVMLTVTVFAAWASAAGGSKAAVHNASTTAGIEVLTLVASYWQLVLDTRRNTALRDVVVGQVRSSGASHKRRRARWRVQAARRANNNPTRRLAPCRSVPQAPFQTIRSWPSS